MRLASIDQSADHITECGERQVDFCGLLQSNTGSLRFGLSLRASQVNQVQLTGLIALFSLDLNRKHKTTGVVIQGNEL